MDRHLFLEKYWKRYPTVDELQADCRLILGFKPDTKQEDTQQEVIKPVTKQDFQLDCQPDLLFRGALKNLRTDNLFPLLWIGLQPNTQSDQQPDTQILSEIIFNDIHDLFKIFVPQDLVAVFTIPEKSLKAKACIGLLSPNVLGKDLNSTKKNQLQLWNQFIKAVDQFFQQKEFLQVQTPTLVVCPGTEPFLDYFETTLMGAEKKLYLPTSPELHLKKMLARGYEKIYEMRPCFRNKEISSQHQPEFWMLEWYRAYETLNDIQQDVKELVQYLVKVFRTPTETSFSFQDLTCAQAFAKYLHLNLTPNTTLAEFKQWGQSHPVLKSHFSQWQHFDVWDDIYYFLFIEYIEPQLLKDHPVLFLRNYPPSQAALARLTAEGWGDRFEFYWNGLEIANAFHELNDPVLQRQRAMEDLELKSKIGKSQIPPVDEDFLQHLQAGMPPSAGIALGLDRLFMALFNIKDITQFREFFW